MSLRLRLTEALMDLFILILVIPREPGEAGAVPFGTSLWEAGVISVMLSVQPLLSPSAIRHQQRCGQAKLTQIVKQRVSLLHLAVAEDL